MKRQRFLLSLLSSSIASVILTTASLAAPLDKKPEASTDIFHPAALPSIREKREVPPDKPFAEHLVVFHISSGDAFAQKLVLNNASNMLKTLGPDKVAIEIVAYGPGLRTLFKESSNARRIDSMAKEGIVFSGCANTMTAMGRDHDSLLKVAKVVPGGVLRIMELQEAGWTYIRP